MHIGPARLTQRKGAVRRLFFDKCSVVCKSRMVYNNAMALIQRTGDFFTTRLPALGHGCNTRGAFGAGVALAVRQKYPEVYAPYAAACRNELFTPGSLLPVKTRDDRWLLNIATQVHPGRDARLDLIDEGVRLALDFCKEEGLEGMAIPRLGAGIGGLKWEDVLETLEAIMEEEKYADLTLEVWTL